MERLKARSTASSCFDSYEGREAASFMGHGYEISLFRTDTLITSNIWLALLGLVLRLQGTFQRSAKVLCFTVKHSLERRSLSILSELFRRVFSCKSVCCYSVSDDPMPQNNATIVGFLFSSLSPLWQVTCQPPLHPQTLEKQMPNKQFLRGWKTCKIFLKSLFGRGSSVQLPELGWFNSNM